ncbi:MAG: glycosyltransferase family 4 protein [bacterium]|nr:glycosyltransferase family 4 protein [bacterium]
MSSAEDRQPRFSGQPTVLVLGPFSATGGIASVCRSMIDGEPQSGWRVLPFDNTKTTPPGRSWVRAMWAHAALLAGWASAILWHRPALVHIHTCSYRTFFRSMPDILIARILRCPVVLHVHGGYFHDFLHSLRGTQRRAVRAHLRMCRQVIVLGSVWKRRLGQTLPLERVSVVPNGVAIPRARRPRPIDRPLRVACIGDLSPGKAFGDLIEAIAGLPPAVRREVRVELIGGGSSERRASLETLIHDRGLAPQVRLRGLLPARRTAACLRSADVFVLPSRGEGLPVAWLEAMAWGIPSVVTRVGAIPEVVTDGVEAFLVDPGDCSALTERLARLLEDAELRCTMGCQARDRVREDFGVERFRANLDRVWTAALHRQSTLPALSSASTEVQPR